MNTSSNLTVASPIHARAEETVVLERAGRLIADTAHDLRSPLAATTGLIQLVMEDAAPAMPAEHREHLHIAMTRCEEMQRLINDMLSLERIRTGLPRAIRGAIDLSQLQLSVEGLVAKDAAQRGIRLVWRGFDQTASAIWGDEDKLRRWYMNLILNAIAATSTGGRITVYALPGDGGSMRLGVRDTGSGLSDTERAQLLTYGRTTSQGLGISICRQIANLHYSHLWLNTEVGVGTAFEMDVPMHAPASIATLFARWMSSSGYAAKRGDGFDALPADLVTASDQIWVQTCAAVTDNPSHLDAADQMIQSDASPQELVFRASRGGWVIAWDESAEPIAERRQRITNAIEEARPHGSPKCSLCWSTAQRFSTVGSQRSPLVEAFVRGAFELDEVAADSEGEMLDEANQVRSGRLERSLRQMALDERVTARLHHELRQLAAHFRARQDSLQHTGRSTRSAPGKIMRTAQP